ncbi:dipeptide/oligopeptide/nickel ABC transporter permease/ATP-binding protein [Nonomuraea typhae]|uniref:dipeptide/oligopeptide/nickel ABC transporter permease/ATP-binding protein n=1 Tax=Nonomuraea typhae TaxID=2603600 RepID=UPI0012F7177A|nr:dipeptide/oligopeptide/nickel ABC transporter permease/ATP-binding protein [Nonomuraea typhae]
MAFTWGGKWAAAVRTPVGACSAVLLLLVAALAVLAPVLWGEAAEFTDTKAILQDPSSAHLLGTDRLGRDILLRILVATRLSVSLALAATAIGLVVGVVLGLAPSVLPRRAGRMVTAAVNIAVAFPALLLALFLAVIFGVGMTGAVLAIGLAGAPSFARLTHTLAASVSGRDYVAAAKVAGVGRIRLMTRHILPNIAEPLIINATIGAGASLLAFAGLSFLGIGIQAPAYDWGRLLGEGLDRIYTNPLAALAPGAAVVLIGLAFNLFGETAAAVLGLRAPRTRYAARGDATNVTPSAEDDLLVVEDLEVSFPGVTPVRGVSFSVRSGEAVGIVGESGSGKSLTALAAAALIEPPGHVRAGRLDFLGTAVLATRPADLRKLLGTNLSMVFQDPMTSFNPTRRIGRQLAEVAEVHQGASRRDAMARAVDRLRAVHVTDPERRVHQYPHEFSGGMRQRAMIGMGLMAQPRLVIADEPTTALDVRVQREVLRLLSRIREDGAAVLLISHDITVIKQTCSRLLVMYAGQIVEDLPVAARPRHPYTRSLLAAVPDLKTDRNLPLATIPGRPPDPSEFPAGCAFAPRCALAEDRCSTEAPPLTSLAPTHRVACWHPEAAS